MSNDWKAQLQQAIAEAMKKPVQVPRDGRWLTPKVRLQTKDELRPFEMFLPGETISHPVNSFVFPS